MTLEVPFLDLGALHAEIRPELERLWADVLDDGRFIGGPSVEAFEQAFAQYCGAAACVGVGNGTDALELILAALGVGPGDEVVLPANTFVATAEAVRTVGAVPRFVDVLPDTLNIDPDAVAAAVTPRTAAVIAVHLYGQPADVAALGALTARHGLALVEDSAQAHGARFEGRRTGTLGIAAGFSFYPGKNLGAIGDAGAVVTDDLALAARIRSLGDHGRVPHDRYACATSGRNSRMDALQGAVLRHKLQRLDEQNAHRARAVARYRELLPDVCRPVSVDPRATSVYHLNVVQVAERSRVGEALTAAGIGWGLHYPVPCHLQPAFVEHATGPLPVAEAAAERILSLPVSPTITDAQVERVCEVLHTVCGS